MKLEYLRYLCEVEKTGSINSAADRMNISHQGMSRALRTLEDELNIEVFKTSNTGIQLTDQGHLLVKTAYDLLNRWEEFLEQLETFDKEQDIKSVMSIRVTSGILDAFFKNVLQILAVEHPNIMLNILEGDHLDILHALQNQSIDLGVLGVQYTIIDKIFPEFVKTKDQIKFVPLYQYKLFVQAGIQSPIAKNKSVSMKTLLKYPLVISAQSELENNMTYRWLQLYGDPKIKFVTSDNSIYHQLILDGEAIGLAAKSNKKSVGSLKNRNVVYIPIRDKDSMATVGYLYHKDREITSAMRAVMKILEDYCKK